MNKRHQRKSVQQRFVHARRIDDHVLCLSSGTSSYDFVNVLAVEGMSYDLKSPDEQLLLNDQFRRLLAGLSYPVQILWRVLPLNLDEYLNQFAFLPEAGAEAQGIWPLISTSHAAFLQQLATRRTLLKRSIYLIIRVSHLDTSGSRAQRLLTRKRRRAQWAQQFEQARQELDLRSSEMMRQLSEMNLFVRRLRGEQELVPFYYSCLTPEKAERFPLPSEVIAAIGRPIQGPQSPHPVRDENAVVRVDSSSYTQEPPRGFSQLADLVAPAAITLAPDCMTVEHEYTRVLVVRGLPRFVSAGWLKPLADLDEPMEVSLHFQPLSSSSMIQQLRRQSRAYHSSQLLAQRKGNDANPTTKVAGDDVSDLLPRLVSGEERMLNVTLLIAVRGRSKKVLDERTARIRAVLQNMLLITHPALFEQEKAFRSCLPHASNEMTGILLDSRSASTFFPFLSNSLFHPQGILEGVTPQGDPVIVDPWGEGMTNANRIILGPPGWGKSHAIKTTIIRQVLKSVCAQQLSDKKDRLRSQIIIVDPESEYAHMTTLFGGQVIRLSPGSAQHVNPFDLPRERAEASGADHGDRLADHVQKLHTLLEIMLANRTPTGAGQLASDEKGLLDRALYETYRKLGISSDRKTHDRPAPLMRDLYDVLESGACGPDPTGLTQRLRRYVYGSLSGLFSGPTNVSLDRVIIDFDIKDLGAELRPVGLFLVSNFVWTESFHSSVPRLLVVDEAATIMVYERGAIFMEDLARRGRKDYVGVWFITQHPQIFQESAIPANCATHILMRQDVTTLDLVERMFKLSSRELQLVRRLPVGEALLLTNEKRLQVRFEASTVEHLLATTNPREIAAWREEHHDMQFTQLLHRLGLDEHATPERPAAFPLLREEQVRALLNSTQQPNTEGQ